MRIYRVTNDRGKILAEGSAMECCDAMGLSLNWLYATCDRTAKGLSQKHLVFEIGCDNRSEKTMTREVVAAAKSWDAFVEPIRKRFNIPVYRGGGEA